MSASDIEGPSPLKFWGRKRSFQPRHFATWSRISPDGNKISWIGKRRWKLRSLPYINTKFGELWSTNGENGTFSTHSKSTFPMLIAQGLRGVAR